MLPRETRGRQIFGGRRAAHCDCNPGAVFLLERAIGRSDLAAQMSISRRRIDNFAGGCSALGQKAYVVVIKIAEEPAQLARGPGSGKCLAIGTSSQRETFGHSPAVRSEHRIKLA